MPDDVSPLPAVLRHAPAVDDAVGIELGRLADDLRRVDPGLAPPAEALVDAAQGGKRLRGALVCWSYAAHAGPDARAADVLGAAVAVELIHLSALVHDDIIDAASEIVPRTPPGIHMPGPSLAPIFASVGAFLLFMLLQVWRNRRGQGLLPLRGIVFSVVLASFTLPSLALTFLAAALGSLASVNAPQFYAQLVRPSWAPPGWLFGPVWTALYVSLGFALWLIWKTPVSPGRSRALALFFVQLGLNLAWSWFFFAYQMPLLALIDLVVLLAAIVATQRAAWHTTPAASLVMLPYLGWCAFALTLNGAVVTLN